MGGQLNIKIDRIPPGNNATHVVVIRPQKYGQVNLKKIYFLELKPLTEGTVCIEKKLIKLLKLQTQPSSAS